MPTETIVAFDLYGTLLSTESIAKELAVHFGQEKAASLAALWRRYQLEYTWRLNSMSTPIYSFPSLLPLRTSPTFPIAASSANSSQKTNASPSRTSPATLSTML